MNKKLCILFIVIIVIIIMLGFSKRLLYAGLDSYVAPLETEEVEVLSRHGLGKIVITPPPPTPSIFMVDRRRTPAEFMIDLNRVPGNPRYPVEIEAYLNENGMLSNPIISSSSDDKEADNYILNRIKHWEYTGGEQGAEGPIKFIVKVRAGEAIIDLSAPSFTVKADSIARGPYLGLFDIKDFRNGIKGKIGSYTF